MTGQLHMFIGLAARRGDVVSGLLAGGIIASRALINYGIGEMG